jgi:transcriptional regulator with XRE-family HTH domain
MKLKHYRTKIAKLSRAKAAAELGCDQVQLWRWETGRSVPTPGNIHAIIAWSKGKVTANELLAAAKGVAAS